MARSELQTLVNRDHVAAVIRAGSDGNEDRTESQQENQLILDGKGEDARTSFALCSRRYSKGNHTLSVCTVFGQFTVRSPRLRHPAVDRIKPRPIRIYA